MSHDAVATLDELRNILRTRLHGLGGNGDGQWATAMNAQYRIVFDRRGSPANVEITDCRR